MTERVLFLDIDGVLVNEAAMKGEFGRYHNRPMPDPACVAALNHICDTCKPQIVISSTWRLGSLHHRIMLLNWLAAAGAAKNVDTINFTVDLSTMQNGLYVATTRGAEIAAWLKDRDWPFAILDDGNDMGELSNRLVRTNPQTGLTMDDAERAIEMLKEVEG